MSTGGLDASSIADAGAYLARLVRLDPAAVVRLRPAGPGAVTMWARLPFDALVTRGLRADVPADATLRAADLLDAFDTGSPGLPQRYDAQWRWPLPPEPGSVLERIPAAEVHRLAAAAAGTLRVASTVGVHGRGAGERIVRDALLDHVAIVVTTDAGQRVEVPQRLVQAVARMGFLGTAGVPGAVSGNPAEPVDGAGWVEVRGTGAWVGLAAAYGTAWHRAAGPLLVRLSGPQRP